MTEMKWGRMRLPLWLWAVAGLGVAWNLFGIAQLVDFATQTRASLMMKGMSAAAADLYYGLPVWMTLAFAVGSGGGLLGSVTLACRRSATIPILALSLAGYLALFAGDYAYGVFAAIPGQMAVLVIVVAIAALLLAAGLRARQRGLID